jgi:hypothetical protein
MKTWIGLIVCALSIRSEMVAAQATIKPDADPRIQQLIASISQQRLQELDAKLAGFGTRETLSNAASPGRGVAAAREWIFEELQRSSPKLKVSFETFQLAVQSRVQHPVELRNVIAVLPGKTARRVYITGHYDSVNVGPGSQGALNSAAPGSRVRDPQDQPTFDHDTDAPGANDDGSGTALTMELARVFAESGIEFDATLVFACWAGEEQRLLGSGAHAQKLAAEKGAVEAMLSNDIVGNIRGGNGIVDAGSVRVYAVGPEDSMARSLARYIERAAEIYVLSHRVRLMAREDRFGRGSDQSAFTSAGYPAVVFRESRENFSKQHSANDTLDGVDYGYLAQNARVNAAAAASLALAPAAPVVTGSNGAALISRDPSGYDATLRWTASNNAAGYRVYWRDTWSNDWQHELTIGNVTLYTLPNVSIDDYVFGVSAIGPDGHESLISAYVAAVRKVPEIKLVK